MFPTTHVSFDTRSVRGGLQPDPATGAILTPLYQSTTFVQPEVGKDLGYTYTRSKNPTVHALERNLGTLEDALPAVAFSTGMASITGLFLALLRAGDHVVVSDVVYGGTVRLLSQVLERFGVGASFVDAREPTRVRDAIRSATRLVLVETPANPTLKLTDIAAVAQIAHEAGVVLAVDNTFLTPALQSPLDLGADVSVYSTTKYIEGHNTTVGGALVSRDEELLERFAFVQNAIGFAQAPFESWLTLRGIKTLPIRMQQHSRHALHVARWLTETPEVARITYPGLETFEQFDLARRQQRGGGGMIAFELRGGAEAGVRLMNRVRLCSLAESLGAVETLITHPATMTHAEIPPAERQRLGITDGLVRLSVGLEDPDDIIADLHAALH